MASLLHRFGFLISVLLLIGTNSPLSASSGGATLQLTDASELQFIGAGSITLSSGTLVKSSIMFNGTEFTPMPPSKDFVFNNGGGSVKINSSSERIIKYNCTKKQLISISKNIELLDWNQSLEQLPNELCFEYDDNNQICKITDEHGLGFNIYYNEYNNLNKIISDSGNVVYDLEKANFLFSSMTERKEKPSDKITLIFCGAGPYEYHQISYYKNSENSWIFDYERELRSIPF